jgi:hypothetical protein
VVQLDQREQQVDARGDAGRGGQRSVGDEQGVRLDPDERVAPARASAAATSSRSIPPSASASAPGISAVSSPAASATAASALNVVPTEEVTPAPSTEYVVSS